jgi:L-ascorbate metabolism protein UlaG (beta-lactamase superfamily)
MKITRVGHACVLLEGSKTLIIDPFITDNPVAPLTTEEIPKVDYVLVTHDHFDHFGDAVKLAKRDQAQLIAIYEITARGDVVAAGVKTTGFNIGGTVKDGGVSISLTPAVHSADNGSPTGVVVKLDGKTIYHAGDTALFSDMQLIPELFGELDVALLPIGGHFTMDVDAADKATELLKPKVTIPIHYNTWPLIQADPNDLVKLATNTKVEIVEQGETYEVTG